MSDENGQNILTNMGPNQNDLGILASEGLDTQNVLVSNNKEYTIEIAVFGAGIGSKTDPSLAGFGTGLLEIKTQKSNEEEKTSEQANNIAIVPDWIKSNAGWWAEGQLSDDEFVSGIQYMIKEKIIQISTNSKASDSEYNEIPSWIKQNAGWWANGEIDDASFVQGIQFLVENGIILVQ